MRERERDISVPMPDDVKLFRPLRIVDILIADWREPRDRGGGGGEDAGCRCVPPVAARTNGLARRGCSASGQALGGPLMPGKSSAMSLPIHPHAVPQNRILPRYHWVRAPAAAQMVEGLAYGVIPFKGYGEPFCGRQVRKGVNFVWSLHGDLFCGIGPLGKVQPRSGSGDARWVSLLRPTSFWSPSRPTGDG